jgi:hypothetical protein
LAQLNNNYKNTIFTMKTPFKKLLLGFTALALVTGFSACKDDDPKPENPEELITTLKLTFTDSANTANNFTVTFADPDGPGGNTPTTYDSIALQTNKTYLVSVQLLNESVSPAEDITLEVEEEKDEHLFGYTTSTNVAITTTDFDSNNIPVGIQTKWKTTSASVGNTTVVLKHQPGIKTGDIALGETDVEVVFYTAIQ